MIIINVNRFIKQPVRQLLRVDQQLWQIDAIIFNRLYERRDGNDQNAHCRTAIDGFFKEKLFKEMT